MNLKFNKIFSVLALIVVLMFALNATSVFAADTENATYSKSYSETGSHIEYSFTMEYSATDSTDNLYTEAMYIAYFDPAGSDINVSLWTTDATINVLPTIQACSDLEGDYFYTCSVAADTIEGTGQRTVNTIIDASDTGLPALYLRIKLDGLAGNPATATVKGVIIVPKPENAVRERLGGWADTN